MTPWCLINLFKKDPSLLKSHQLENFGLKTSRTFQLLTPRILLLKMMRTLPSSETLQFNFLFLTFSCISSYFQTISSTLLFLGFVCKHFTLFMVYFYYFTSVTFSMCVDLYFLYAYVHPSLCLYIRMYLSLK